MLPSPCSVAACGARAFRRLAVAAVRLPMLLFCDAMVWAVTFLTFPVRLLAAADRERKVTVLRLESGQMERVVWENRDLEQRLRVALKEKATMEDILDEMEEENEDAFARIDLLESQLKALKKENMRLKEQRDKSVWDKAAATAPAVAGSGGGKKKADEQRAWEGKE
ncbi:hypothetical protein ZWY2020_058815 [Hordeum vulgare]|nr:hypothetical protein ZWY2020_058815 [Hordeum vulgare]